MPVRVKMELPDKDMENAKQLTERFNMVNKAATVSTVLNLMREFVDVIDSDGQLLIRHKNGSVEQLILPGVDRN